MSTIVRRAAGTPLTEQQRQKLKALAARPDSEIDTSDIPELTEKLWKTAVRNPFYRPVKRQVTVRLDSDILAWLRRQGRGYQTKMNALLRNAMLRDLTQPRRR
jgi:uncharacterized protein (DUF4415 family)